MTKTKSIVANLHMNRQCRLKASLQNQSTRSKTTFLKTSLKLPIIYYHKDTKFVLQLTETAIFIATPMKKQI